MRWQSRRLRVAQRRCSRRLPRWCGGAEYGGGQRVHRRGPRSEPPGSAQDPDQLIVAEPVAAQRPTIPGQARQYQALAAGDRPRPRQRSRHHRLGSGPPARLEHLHRGARAGWCGSMCQPGSASSHGAALASSLSSHAMMSSGSSGSGSSASRARRGGPASSAHQGRWAGEVAGAGVSGKVLTSSGTWSLGLVSDLNSIVVGSADISGLGHRAVARADLWVIKDDL